MPNLYTWVLLECQCAISNWNCIYFLNRKMSIHEHAYIQTHRILLCLLLKKKAKTKKTKIYNLWVVCGTMFSVQFSMSVLLVVPFELHFSFTIEQILKTTPHFLPLVGQRFFDTRPLCALRDCYPVDGYQLHQFSLASAYKNSFCHRLSGDEQQREYPTDKRYMVATLNSEYNCKWCVGVFPSFLFFFGFFCYCNGLSALREIQLSLDQHIASMKWTCVDSKDRDNDLSSFLKDCTELLNEFVRSTNLNGIHKYGRIYVVVIECVNVGV